MSPGRGGGGKHRPPMPRRGGGAAPRGGPAASFGRAGALLLLRLLLAGALVLASSSRAVPVVRDSDLDGSRGGGRGGGPDLAAAGRRDPVRPAGRGRRGLQFLEGLSAVVSAVAGAVADGGGGERQAGAGPDADLAAAFEQALVTVAEEITQHLCGDGLGALPGQRNAVCEVSARRVRPRDAREC